MSELMENRAKVFKALGHPARLTMVDALAGGEKCVCELNKLVDADVSTVSKHLTVLREAGVVCSRRVGSNVYYALRMTCVPGFLQCVDNDLKKQAFEHMDALA